MRPRIDVTAFASIMFVLLYTFLGPAGIVMDPPRPSVQLPHADSAVPMQGANREDALIVFIKRDGKIFFDGQQVIPAELPARIQGALKQGSPRVVYIEADARARYRNVLDVLDGIRDAKIEKIAFITSGRRTRLSPSR